jgi:hypothetical protein
MVAGVAAAAAMVRLYPAVLAVRVAVAQEVLTTLLLMLLLARLTPEVVAVALGQMLV